MAHPPFGLLPGLLGYALLMRLADTEGPRPLRSAFFRGWLAGVGVGKKRCKAAGMRVVGGVTHSAPPARRPFCNHLQPKTLFY